MENGIFRHTPEHKHKARDQVDVNCPYVGDLRKSFLSSNKEAAHCQDCDGSERYPCWGRVIFDPKTNPRQSNDQRCGYIPTNEVKVYAPLELKCYSKSSVAPCAERKWNFDLVIRAKCSVFLDYRWRPREICFASSLVQLFRLIFCRYWVFSHDELTDTLWINYNRTEESLSVKSESLV